MDTLMEEKLASNHTRACGGANSPEKAGSRNFLVVGGQDSGFTAVMDQGSIPSLGTKISQAAQHGTSKMRVQSSVPLD